jgi:hypothetical protein
MPTSPQAAVDLYWIPLGAGGHCVRVNGRVYEAIDAARRRRARCHLYHAALVVELDGERYAIEVAPSPDADQASRYLGWWRLFRYEVRCWRGGSIPDLAYAVGSLRRLTTDALMADRLVGLTGSVPTPVWGRDELAAGEMWNSNSVVSWLLARSGVDTQGIEAPAGGRAPGWNAGLVVAHRPVPDVGPGASRHATRVHHLVEL